MGSGGWESGKRFTVREMEFCSYTVLQFYTIECTRIVGKNEHFVFKKIHGKTLWKPAFYIKKISGTAVRVRCVRIIGYWFPKAAIDQSHLTSSTRTKAKNRKKLFSVISLCLDFHRNKTAKKVFSYLRYFLFHGGVSRFFPEEAKKEKILKRTGAH